MNLRLAYWMHDLTSFSLSYIDGIYVDCCFHPKEMRLGIRLIWIYIFIYIYGVWNLISCKLVLLLLQLRLQPKIDQMKEQVKPALCDFIEADTNYKRLKKDINKHKSKKTKDEDEEADEPEEEEKPSRRIKTKQSPTDPETSTKSGKGNKAKAKKKGRAAPPSPAEDEPPKKKKRALKGNKASKWNWFWWWPFSISVQKRFAKTPCFEKDLKRDGFGSLHGENLNYHQCGLLLDCFLDAVGFYISENPWNGFVNIDVQHLSCTWVQKNETC